MMLDEGEGEGDWGGDGWYPDGLAGESAAAGPDDLWVEELAPGDLVLEELDPGPGADLALMSDVDVIEAAVQCREAASRAQGRMYRALQELERRRPPSKRYRRGEDVRERRDAADGMENAPVQPVPVMASTEVTSEIALAFTATEYAAGKLAETSADLWARLPRLPRLHRELEAGRTDYDRVKVLWEGTQDLSNEDAGKVDAMLSATSGSMTTGELRDAVKRAVIRIDPAAADKRRERAEKRARASLYANRNGTATLALEDIPAAQGAAAKARVNAIARAAKSAGAVEELPALEAKTALGLILGTLPLIPPQVPPGDSPGDPGGPCGPDSGQGGPPGPDSGPGGSPGPAAGGPGGDPGGEAMPWPRIPDTSGAAAPGCASITPGLALRRQGRIKLLTPWRTLAGMAGEPGDLTWFGDVTPGTARDLARAAATDQGARWSLIVTGDDGHAIAYAVLRHPRETGTPGLVGEITLTIAASLAAGLNYDEEMRERARQMLAGLAPELAALLEEAISVADKAAAEAELRAIMDEAAGGCAHTMEVASYKVPETMRRWLAARDRICRNPICRQRAAQCDWDHTVPFGRGGRTCPCGLGALCRKHHQLKQLPGWQVGQDGRGRFTWTTPAGLTYRKEPFKYLV
ncbi:MAG: HNH endonuclease [Trebonia sp.]